MRLSLRSPWSMGLWLTSGITLAGWAIAPALAEPEAPDPAVAAVAQLLEGVMDTTQQAATNPKAPSVRMTTCQIAIAPPAPRRGPAIFLYQEQALTTKLDQPYRQRILKLQSGATANAVESLSFKPAQPKPLIGLCNRPPAQRVMPVTAIGDPVCSVLLTPQADTTRFLGKTPGTGCPANYRGATRITNEIELFVAGMNTWDRGFDASGKQVWGARSEAYQFRRPTSSPPPSLTPKP